jgi:hypothetical protein
MSVGSTMSCEVRTARLVSLKSKSEKGTSIPLERPGISPKGRRTAVKYVAEEEDGCKAAIGDSSICTDHNASTIVRDCEYVKPLMFG